MAAFSRILMPIDGSEASNTALACALRIAKDDNARLRLIHAVNELAAFMGEPEGAGDYPGEVMRRARAAGEKVLADAAAAASAAGVQAEAEFIEAPGERLGDTVVKDASRWNADLIVMGTHGRRGISRVLLGSGAEQVVRLSTVPVLTVRPPEQTAG
jgi:nucleotide-binding universal stress UspA family protein